MKAQRALGVGAAADQSFAAVRTLYWLNGKTVDAGNGLGERDPLFRFHLYLFPMISAFFSVTWLGRGGRFLILLGCVLGGAPLALAQQFTVTPGRASALYVPGETISWEVSITGTAAMRNPEYKIKPGGLDIASWTALTLTNGKATISTPASTTPGWVLLELRGTDASSATVSGYGGALISPEQITPASTVPADFDTFWADKIAELEAVPMNPVVTAGVSGRAGVDYALITMDNIRGTHIQGQLARPTTGTKFPAVLVLQWAGVYALDKTWVTSRAASGWLALNIQPHDIAVAESASYYTDLNNGALNGYYRIGNEDKETSYFLRMYLSCYRAVEYLASRPDWDGKTIVVLGASQGGQQSLLAAALNARVTTVLAEVPAGSDQWGLDVGRLPSFPTQLYQAWDRDLAKVRAACLYYDIVHFAPKIRCPVLIGAGLIDTIVPAPGLYASYNQIPGGKEIVPMPQEGHSTTHAAYNTRANAWLNEIRLGQAPTITTPPVSAAVALGAPVEFSVVASGGTVYSYQWQRDGVDIPGANADHLRFTATTAGTSQYTCAVRSPGGLTLSPAATLTVAQAAPVVIWSAPAAITYGTALSATELAATADMPGTFTYTPAAGTVLPAGTAQTLRVTFTPTDTRNYTTVTVPVTITVNPAPLLVVADDKAKVQSVANPPLTCTYVGFVQGETSAVLDQLPVLSTTALATSPVGTYPITLTGGADDNYTLTLQTGTLTVVATAAPPRLDASPVALTVNAGIPAQFSVTMTSTVTLVYQWQVSTNGGTTWAAVTNGTVYAGVGTDALSVLKPTAVMKGNQYRCVITDGINPAVTTTAATLTVKWSQFFALSARAPVGTGDQTLFLGFVYAGGGKPTMIRGVGPGLVKGDANLAGQVLADPVLTLNELQTVNNVAQFVAIASNDNWGGAEEIRTKMSALGMGALDDSSADAVMLTTPTRAVYTAQISGANQTTGLALAEVYDANFSDKAKRLTALSVRNQVGTGSSMLIAGLVVSGDAPKRVIIRGVGPGLVPTVAASAVLANPTLQLNKLNTATMTWSVVVANDDWGGSAELATAMSQAGMGALATDSKDAVLLIELQPGIYTAQVSGVGDTTGIGLVEVYEAP